MKFTPKTQEQIDTENLLPDGAYDAEITNAKEAISKAGNPMIEINLKVYTNDGRFRFVRDWLMESVPHKILHCAESLGLEAEYSNGDIQAEMLVGKNTAVLIGQRASKGNFSASNTVKDYLTIQELTEWRSRPSRPTNSGQPTSSSLPKPEDDDLPF